MRFLGLAFFLLVTSCITVHPITSAHRPVPVAITKENDVSTSLVMRYPGGIMTPDGQTAFVEVHGVGISAIDTTSGSVRWEQNGNLTPLAVDRGVVALHENLGNGTHFISLRTIEDGNERARIENSLPTCSTFEEPHRDGSVVVFPWVGSRCPSGTPMPDMGPPPRGTVRVDMATGRRVEEASAPEPYQSPEEIEKAAIAAMPASIDRTNLVSYYTGTTWQRRPLFVAGRHVAMMSAHYGTEFVYWNDKNPEELTRVKQGVGSMIAWTQLTTDGGHVFIRRAMEAESFVISLADGQIVAKIRVGEKSSLAQHVTVAGGLFHWAESRRTGLGYGEDFTIMAADAIGQLIWERPIIGKHAPNPA